jgi:hypothetical protein
MIISPQPARGELLDFLDQVEQVMGQPVVAYGSVVALDIGILLRIAWLNEFELDAALVRHATVMTLMYSGPLSQRITLGAPLAP